MMIANMKTTIRNNIRYTDGVMLQKMEMEHYLDLLEADLKVVYNDYQKVGESAPEGEKREVMDKVERSLMFIDQE